MTVIRQDLENENSTSELGRELSLFGRKGLVICLSGDLGTGKTTLARGYIRALAPVLEKNIDVPSPTFALVQPYDDLRIPLHHFDLYRTTTNDEIWELGIFDDLDNRITLIEWPEKLGEDIPDDRIDIFLSSNGNTRQVQIKGYGNHQNLVARFDQARTFLDSGPWSGAHRSSLQGDASSRRYELLVSQSDEKALLMDMPAGKDGPVVSGGKTYGQIANLATGITAVSAINKGLSDNGLSSPECYQSDLPNGFMVQEYFGDAGFGQMIINKSDISEPLKAATVLLANMTDKEWPSQINLDNGQVHKIPHYDRQSFLIETELLLDWYWSHITGSQPSPQTRKQFSAEWAQVIDGFYSEKPVWVMRDYHSPNLIWLPERQGDARIGLIDTQDCILGPPAYDLVSLLQDARLDLPDGSEDRMFELYCQRRLQLDSNFDQQDFTFQYCGLGAQRATKILGIFARLFVRDSKPGYLKHLPRVSAALERNLNHPKLTMLAGWYKKYLPHSKTSQRTGSA